MKAGLGGLMKQAQKMQEDMQQAQAEIANMEVSGQAGGGMVSVVMTGRHDLRRVNIDDSVMDDKEMLEDKYNLLFKKMVGQQWRLTTLKEKLLSKPFPQRLSPLLGRSLLV